MFVEAPGAGAQVAPATRLALAASRSSWAACVATTCLAMHQTTVSTSR